MVIIIHNRYGNLYMNEIMVYIISGEMLTSNDLSLNAFSWLKHGCYGIEFAIQRSALDRQFLRKFHEKQIPVFWVFPGGKCRAYLLFIIICFL